MMAAWKWVLIIHNVGANGHLISVHHDFYNIASIKHCYLHVHGATFQALVIFVINKSFL